MLGGSGTSADMKELLQPRASDPRAELAIQVFVLSCLKAIGGFTAVRGGLDTLVFTGGIGENAADVRAEICADLGHLGVSIDAAANASRRNLISACAVWVMPTDEERIIARHARTVLEKRVSGRICCTAAAVDAILALLQALRPSSTSGTGLAKRLAHAQGAHPRGRR